MLPVDHHVFQRGLQNSSENASHFLKLATFDVHVCSMTLACSRADRSRGIGLSSARRFRRGGGGAWTYASSTHGAGHCGHSVHTCGMSTVQSPHPTATTANDPGPKLMVNPFTASSTVMWGDGTRTGFQVRKAKTQILEPPSILLAGRPLGKTVGVSVFPAVKWREHLSCSSLLR